MIENEEWYGVYVFTNIAGSEFKTAFFEGFQHNWSDGSSQSCSLWSCVRHIFTSSSIESFFSYSPCRYTHVTLNIWQYDLSSAVVWMCTGLDLWSSMTWWWVLKILWDQCVYWQGYILMDRSWDRPPQCHLCSASLQDHYCPPRVLETMPFWLLSNLCQGSLVQR